MKGATVSAGNCVGWWQQKGLGRQPMEDLQVEVTVGAIQGSGTDIIGDFELLGAMGKDGLVHIVKKYHRKHSVEYYGQYDGEGTFFGTWMIDNQTGSWSIKILRAP